MDNSFNLKKEAAVSAVINALISTGFFFAFFSGISSIPIWGSAGYAFDFVPQSFAVSLMSALVPGLIARKKLTSGTVGGTAVPTVPGIFVRAIAWAIGGLVIGAGLAALVLKVSGIETIASAPALIVKIVYGAVLGAIVTYLFLDKLVKRHG